MENNNKISMSQMIFILILSMVGTGMLTLPRDLAEVVEYDQWIVLLAGGIVVLITILAHGAIIRLKPKKQYFEILCHALTKPVAYIVGFAYVIYMTVFLGLVIRIFGDVIKMYLLVNTPIEVINISILVVSIYLTRKGIEVLGRMLEFLFPMLILFAGFMFTLSFVNADFANLLPVFRITLNEVLDGLPVTVLSFAGFEVLLFFGVYLHNPKEATKASIAIGVVFIFYLIVVVSAIVQFGPIQVKYLLWPTLNVFDTIELPGLFIENVQIVLMSLWVLIVVTTIAPIYLASITMTTSLTGSREHAYLAAPFLPIIYFISLIPENISENYAIIGTFTRYFTSIMVFGIPIVVLISLVIQKKLRKETESNV